MRIFRQPFIPFPGYKAMMLFQTLWTHKGVNITEEDERHEAIHAKQELECGIILWLLVYGICWLIAGCSYHGNAMEQEAYANEKDPDYLSNRKHYAWVKYIGKQPVKR